MMDKNSIEGNHNLFVGRDLFIQLSPDDRLDIFRKFFAAADDRFKKEISESGQIFRLSKRVEYSSESLFTSLMQIGLPVDVAANIPINIVGFLRDIVDQKGSNELLDTTDIRMAVVRAIESLPNISESFTDATISMWAAAYIRRYGNPDKEFVKVIDYGNERDLNYDYIESVLLPHLLNRILGLPKDIAPFKEYHTVFSSTMISDMAKEIMRSVNTLNLYTISYKTILYLIQDIILEPPHPWIVNESTLHKVVDYNFERMMHHHDKITERNIKSNLALIHHSFQEYFRHSCAVILSMYGAFLGVGNRYGLVELLRILKIKMSNPTLWSYCRIQYIDNDLKSLNYNVELLRKCLNRIQDKLHIPGQDGKYLKNLYTDVAFLKSLVWSLKNKLNC